MQQKTKIRILHVFHSFNMGGLENGVVNLINRSDPDIFDHQICCLSITGTAESRLEKKVPIFEMNKCDGHDWKMMYRLFKLMKDQKPHIVHTRNWGSVDAIIPAKLAGVSIVIHSEHGWNNDDPRGKNIKRRIARKFLSYLVDHFIAVSDDIKNWMVQSVGISTKKISVIINGVDTKKFHKGDKVSVKSAFGFSSNDFIIGTVGRLSPIKNQLILLKAFSKLDHKQKSFRLVLVGDGPEKNRLKELKGKLPWGERIFFLGLRNDINQILQMFDVFVLPSKSEGICNTILEAMASGLPVIATHVGGNPELVVDNLTGFLIPSNDPDILSATLKRYIDGKDGLIIYQGNNARQRAVNKFSLEKMVSGYEKIYTDLTYNKRFSLGKSE